MFRKQECVAMLLAGGQGSRLGVLTKGLAKPAVPYGGKYRIIDFPLSLSLIHISAIEFKCEGWVMGVGAKLFALAGPVIVYGISSSIIYGVILWLFTL